jgi:hypothetical protein
MVEVKHRAFADIDEETDILLASRRRNVSRGFRKGGVIRLT